MVGNSELSQLNSWFFGSVFTGTYPPGQRIRLSDSAIVAEPRFVLYPRRQGDPF
jgi:hypothetical protein